MRIDHAIIADWAEIVGGKLYLMGGGWTTFRAAGFPATARFAVVVGIRIEWEETNRAVPVRLIVEDDDGTELVKIDGNVNVGRPPELPPGYSQLAQLAANVTTQVHAPGGHRVRISAGAGDELEDRSLPFRVIQVPGAPAPAS